MITFKEKCLNTISKVRKGSSLISIKGYKNNFGEVSDHKIVFRFNYKNLLKKSLFLLKSKEFLGKEIYSSNYPLYILEEAIEELIFSYERSLTESNPGYTCINVYNLVNDPYGYLIPGIKLHKEEDVIHVEGISVSKNIIKEGAYPKRKSSSKTLAKNFIKKKLPIGKFVQFKLTPDRFEKIILDKKEIKGEI